MKRQSIGSCLTVRHCLPLFFGFRLLQKKPGRPLCCSIRKRLRCESLSGSRRRRCGQPPAGMVPSLRGPGPDADRLPHTRRRFDGQRSRRIAGTCGIRAKSFPGSPSTSGTRAANSGRAKPVTGKSRSGTRTDWSPNGASRTLAAGMTDPSGWKASWIGLEKAVGKDDPKSRLTRCSARMLRKEFDVSKKVKRAVAFYSGWGFPNCT